MGNGSLPKTTILESRENKALGLLSSVSPAMASYPCQWNTNTPKKNVAPRPVQEIQAKEVHASSNAHKRVRTRTQT